MPLPPSNLELPFFVGKDNQGQLEEFLRWLSDTAIDPRLPIQFRQAFAHVLEEIDEDQVSLTMRTAFLDIPDMKWRPDVYVIRVKDSFTICRAQWVMFTDDNGKIIGYCLAPPDLGEDPPALLTH